MGLSALRVEALTKRYGRQRALADVSFSVESGSLCALLGGNGAGKSTLLGILSTLVRATSGTVTYSDGEREQPAGATLRREIGVLAHDSFLYGGLSAVENLLFFAKLYEVADPLARISTLLDEVGLSEEARTRACGEYSRGMLQRVALARALLADPSVLLLDEPFTGLDRTGAQALARTMKRAKVEGRLILCVTHDLESIGDVTDHVVMLASGRLVADEKADGGFSYAQLRELYHLHAA